MSLGQKRYQGAGTPAGFAVTSMVSVDIEATFELTETIAGANWQLTPLGGFTHESDTDP
jgi:hypothetical protein